MLPPESPTQSFRCIHSTAPILKEFGEGHVTTLVANQEKELMRPTLDNKRALWWCEVII